MRKRGKSIIYKESREQTIQRAVKYFKKFESMYFHSDILLDKLLLDMGIDYMTTLDPQTLIEERD